MGQDIRRRIPDATERVVIELRSRMRPGDQLLVFDSADSADAWLARQPTLVSRASARTPNGVYAVVTHRRELEQPARPNWALVACALSPLAVVVGLLIWQPFWTLTTIGALLALAVYSWAKGHGGAVVEVLTLTRVRMKR